MRAKGHLGETHYESASVSAVDKEKHENNLIWWLGSLTRLCEWQERTGVSRGSTNLRLCGCYDMKLRLIACETCPSHYYHYYMQFTSQKLTYLCMIELSFINNRRSQELYRPPVIRPKHFMIMSLLNNNDLGSPMSMRRVYSETDSVIVCLESATGSSSIEATTVSDLVIKYSAKAESRIFPLEAKIDQ